MTLDRGSSLIALAEALENMSIGELPPADTFVRSLPGNLHPDALDVIANGMHFLADKDIRDRNEGYRLMQEKHMRGLILALRGAESREKLLKFSFLTPL